MPSVPRRPESRSIALTAAMVAPGLASSGISTSYLSRLNSGELSFLSLRCTVTPATDCLGLSADASTATIVKFAALGQSAIIHHANSGFSEVCSIYSSANIHFHSIAPIPIII